MDRIEHRLVLPPGAGPIDRYARFYADGRDGDVVAVYVGLPAPEWPVGQRRWMARAEDLPMIDDGGCSVLNIVYDPRRDRMREIGCNGPPPPDGREAVASPP